MTHRTIVETFLKNAHNYAGDTIIKFKKEKGGDYIDVNWSELEKAVSSFSLGLIQLGLEPGDRVAILSFNRLEWIIADLATLLAGGVQVSIYHTNTPEQCAYIIKDSDAKFVIVEDSVQLAKIQEQKAELNSLEKIIVIEKVTPDSDDRVISFANLLRKGSNASDDLRNQLETRIQNVGIDDMAAIVYTSGTTGPPKGCMISHKNIAKVLGSLHELFQVDRKSNVSLMILPLSHLYPRVSGYYYNISMGIPFAIAESLDTLGQNMMEARPTYFAAVPRIFEKMYDRISGTAEKSSALQRTIFRWAVNVGRERSRKLNSHHSLPFLLRLQFGLADALVFKKIRNLLGGKLLFAVSAGAPLSPQVGEFVHSVGIQVLEFYGLTETISGTITTFEHCRYGTVGKPMPGVEMKLADDGEILIRGNNFMGYYNKPELTSETLIDGWCYTGDIGKWDDDGFLTITDRKKDLIITSGGKNISPQNIEIMLNRVHPISISLVYGDSKKYLTALVTLDQIETEAFAKENGIVYDSFAQLCSSPEIREYVGQGIDQVNQNLAQYETIKRFIILQRELSQEEGELTPTLKLKRKQVTNKYRHLLDALYE